VDEAIASLIVSQIEDGSCLQLGIGGMPNAVGKLIARSDVRDLGVHTEMLADAYLDMYEAGRITNARKALDQGKMTYTFALGSRRLYDFLHDNPACASYPVDYTNRLVHISANDKVVSINNALEVDLYGQVSSESSGFRHITGTGGQFDFAYGAYHSQGGKSFICLSSTVADAKGTVRSRIRPFFSPGTVVTLPRTITHHVVTEYGIACLKGKSTWERAEALIEIAHPDFRDELVREAEKMRVWSPANRAEPFDLPKAACA
jgi:acyl-CoA hydrolase